jgi:hypothetical protein
VRSIALPKTKEAFQFNGLDLKFCSNANDFTSWGRALLNSILKDSDVILLSPAFRFSVVNEYVPHMMPFVLSKSGPVTVCFYYIRKPALVMLSFYLKNFRAGNGSFLLH